MPYLLYVFVYSLCISNACTTNNYTIKRNQSVASNNSRAYNNPYHPEDDIIIENVSDEDGDNLKFGAKAVADQLSDREQVAQLTKKSEQKRLKINGRFYDPTAKSSDAIVEAYK
ncbi:hypothetical protein evm_007830 [Chilo suppressalis]|nr:hypothetical protein evm_007830 [Chilo suppressalis]